MGTSHSPKLQDWSLSIRSLMSYIGHTLELGITQVQRSIRRILLLLLTGWVKNVAIFLKHEIQFVNTRCFSLGQESDKPHRTVRCRAHLLLSSCHSLRLFGFFFFAWSRVLSQIDPVWFSRFLQTGWNFLNHFVTVLWWTASLPFAQQIFQFLSSFRAQW